MAVASTPIEGIKRTNTVVIRNQRQGQGMGQLRRDPNAMDVDRRNNRNCYNCGGFRHMARNYRNRRVGMNRRIETEDNDNLNRNGGLMGSN